MGKPILFLTFYRLMMVLVSCALWSKEGLAGPSWRQVAVFARPIGAQWMIPALLTKPRILKAPGLFTSLQARGSHHLKAPAPLTYALRTLKEEALIRPKRPFGMWTDGPKDRPDETTTRYLDPTNDLAFKKLFSSEARLKDFLNAVLPPELGRIKDLTLISQEEMPALSLGKRSLFDVKCTDEDGHVFIVEMQNRPEQAFLNRVQYYAAHAVSAQVFKGQERDHVMPVVLLALTGRCVFEADVPCISYHWTIEQETQKRLLRSIAYVFIELPKFTKTPEECTAFQDEWLYLFAKWNRTKAPPNPKDPLVQEAYQTLEQFNWTEAERDTYLKCQFLEEIDEANMKKSHTDGFVEGEAKGKTQGLKEGIEKGKAEGLKEGEAKARYEMALQFVTKGRLELDEAIKEFQLSDEWAARLREAVKG